MQQYDKAAPFASHEVNLDGRLIRKLAGIVVDDLLTGFVVLNQSNEELALLVADNQILEASASGGVALVDRLQ